METENCSLTIYYLYYTFQATKEFSKGDPVVEYCGELLSLEAGNERYNTYTEQNNKEGANWGSYMFQINDPAGKKYW